MSSSRIVLRSAGKKQKHEKAILTVFPSGIPTSDNLQTVRFREENEVLSGKISDKITFEGHSDTSNFCHYAVGLVDKEKKECVLVDVPKLFIMNQVYRGESGDSTSELPALSREVMMAEYGSKRSKRKMRKSEKMKSKVADDSTIRAAEEALSGITREEGEQKLFGQTPPCDPDAEKAKKIYPLKKLLTKEEETAIENDIIEFEQAANDLSIMEQWRRDKIYSSYVLDHLGTLSARNLEEKKRRKECKLLVFFEYLLQFYVGRGGEVSGEFPPVLEQKFREKFMGEQVRQDGTRDYVWTPTGSDLLVLWISAVSLHLDKFHTDPDRIAEALGLNAMRCHDYFRALGCSVKLDRKRPVEELERRRYVAVLTAPLKRTVFRRRMTRP